MESKQDFSTWIKAKIEKYDFAENVDFNLHKFMEVRLEGNREVKREITDYFISLDMAKELSMVENNSQGVDFIGLFTMKSEQGRGNAATRLRCFTQYGAAPRHDGKNPTGALNYPTKTPITL